MRKSVHIRVPQVKTFEGTDNDGNTIMAEVRYDDELGNGHNTFSITGSVYEKGKGHIDRNIITCGAIGDIVEKYIPELAGYDKWHLFSADGPMHYIANTIYLARDRSHAGAEIGAPVKFAERFRFDGCPLVIKQPSKGFSTFLKSLDSYSDLVPVEIPHKSEPSKYRPKYTFAGYENIEWYQCPFDNQEEAIGFGAALWKFGPKWERQPIEWCVAVEPDIDAARKCAKCPDCTGDQLRDKAFLEKRLPALIEEFAADVEALGFTF